MLGCKANQEKMVNFVVRSFIITSVIPTRQLSAQIIFTHLHRFTGKSRRKIIFHEKVKISQLALEETKHWSYHSCNNIESLIHKAIIVIAAKCFVFLFSISTFIRYGAADFFPFVIIFVTRVFAHITGQFSNVLCISNESIYCSHQPYPCVG